MRAFRRASGWEQAEPCCHPVDMRIDRESWMPTGKQQDAGDRLRSHAVKFCQERPCRRHRYILQKIEAQMALACLEGVQHRLNPLALQFGESSRANHPSEIIGLGLRNLFPGGKGGAQSGIGAVRVDITGVLRQDRRNQFPEGIVMRGPWR